MRIECKHTLGKEEAIRRIDGWVDAVDQRPIPAGINFEDFSKTWSDNVLKVSCRVKKFGFAPTVSATATVNDDNVVIEFELPGFLKTLMPESKIEEAVQKQVVPLLAGP